MKFVCDICVYDTVHVFFAVSFSFLTGLCTSRQLATYYLVLATCRYYSSYYTVVVACGKRRSCAPVFFVSDWFLVGLFLGEFATAPTGLCHW